MLDSSNKEGSYSKPKRLITKICVLSLVKEKQEGRFLLSEKIRQKGPSLLFDETFSMFLYFLRSSIHMLSVPLVFGKMISLPPPKPVLLGMSYVPTTLFSWSISSIPFTVLCKRPIISPSIKAKT